MKFHNHHGRSHPPDKLLPVGAARSSCRYEFELTPGENLRGGGGRWTRTSRRLRGVISELKRRHRKKARAYGRRLARGSGES